MRVRRNEKITYEMQMDEDEFNLLRCAVNFFLIKRDNKSKDEIILWDSINQYHPIKESK